MRKKNERFRRTSALLAAAVIGMSSIPSQLIFAVEGEGLNNKEEEVASDVIEVSSSDRASFRVDLTNTGDTVTVYRLAKVTWDSETEVHEDENGNYVFWETAVSSWIGKNSDYSTLTTPQALSNASTTIQTAFYTALLGTESADKSGTIFDGSYTLVQVDADDISYTQTSAQTLDEDTAEAKVTAGDWTKSTTYADASGNPVVYHNGSYYLESDASYKSALSSDAVTATVTYTDSTTNASYKVGDNYIEAANYCTVSNLEYGVYAIMGSSELSGVSYKPVTISVIPQKTGPDETWIVQKEFSTNLKAGSFSIAKYINGYKRDSVSVGDTVDFTIEIPYSEYSDRVTLAGSSGTVKPYTYALDDDMSSAFSYVPGSVYVQYRTSRNNEWTTLTNYRNINYTAIANSTYSKTGSDGNGKTRITSDNIGTTLSGTNATVMTDYASGTTAEQESLASTYLGSTAYYYVMGRGDVYTTQIASPASAHDPNFENGIEGYGDLSDSNVYDASATIADFGDNRGGYGISVFACCNAQHLGDYQLFLFRYEDEPNLYYWYYYRDGAYHFICCDDFNDGASTQYRATSLEDVNDGSVDTDGSSVSTLTGRYKIDLSNYCPSSCGNNQSFERDRGYNDYFAGIVSRYQNLTGDTVSHHLVYYANYGAQNVFNVTFNVGAFKQWVYNQQKSSTAGTLSSDEEITYLRICYKAYVTEKAEIASENNTNTATLNFEANASGSQVDQLDDTVNAYVYGIRVYKKDGDTLEGISGAVFSIYQETDIFVNDTWVGTIDGYEYVPEEHYTIGKDDEATLQSKIENINYGNVAYIEAAVAAYNNSLPEDTAEDNKLTTGKFQSLEKFETFFTEANGYYYYTEPAATESGELAIYGTDGNKITYSAGDVITHVYKKLTITDPTSGSSFDGQFTVTDKTNGYLISGVDTGNYIVAEDAAPDGYNRLAEDMLFEMYQLTNTYADANHAGSLASFMDASDQEHLDGIFELTVYNYKGLTLPSTGGMGVLLFTVLGMMIMICTMIFMLVYRKSQLSKADW